MTNSLTPIVDPLKTNYLGLDRGALESFFVDIDEKPFRASQILKWIHQHGVVDFDLMSNISKALRSRLSGLGEIRLPEVALEQRSKDGTRKWLLQMACGNRVETVFIPEPDRGTLCVSSQVGCALGCTFCSTAQQGFNRDLTSAEIIGQLWLANSLLDSAERVSNVVFMGMGEPLLNFDHVVSAIAIMKDDFAYGLSKRRVTVSTSGVVPAIDRLREVTDVSLAVSLHASNDRLRDQIVPLNKKYPLSELLAACRRYVTGFKKRKITFEYVMLEGVNDSVADAKALCKLINNIPCKINLIPFNPFPNSGYRCSSALTISRFSDVVRSGGFVTTTRKTRGDDIDAACGQLVGRVGARVPKRQALAAVATCQ